MNELNKYITIYLKMGMNELNKYISNMRKQYLASAEDYYNRLDYLYYYPTIYFLDFNKKHFINKNIIKIYRQYVSKETKDVSTYLYYMNNYYEKERCQIQLILTKSKLKWAITTLIMEYLPKFKHVEYSYPVCFEDNEDKDDKDDYCDDDRKCGCNKCIFKRYMKCDCDQCIFKIYMK